MPLYEYECQACGRRLEKIQKFSDPELTTCPHCEGRLERVLHAPAVQFSGGGWYKDLYSSAKPAASGKNGASGDGGKSGESGGSSSAGSSSGDSGSGASAAGSSATGSSAAAAPAAPAAPSKS